MTPIERQEPKIIKELPKKVEPNPTVLDCLSNIPKVNIPLVILDDNDEIILETKVPTIVVPHVEAKIEEKVPSNIELVMEDTNNDKPVAKIDTISDVIPENHVIKPQVTSISETVHTTITIKEGKRILLYCDRCAKDQLSLALKYMTINNKLDFLSEMIFLKYRFCNDDKTEILGGSKLNMIFRNLEKK